MTSFFDTISDADIESLRNALELFGIVLGALGVVLLGVRLILHRIVYRLAHKRFFPSQVKEVLSGWEDPTDKLAMEGIRKLARERMQNGGQTDVVTDTRALFQLVQNTYQQNPSSAQFRLDFSVYQLLQCGLLAFCDLHREFHNHHWFRSIRKLTLSQAMDMIKKASHQQQVEARRKSLFRFPWILLLPLTGLIRLIQILTVDVVYIGITRYLYGLLLLRGGYYAMYLYGRKNSNLLQRMGEINQERLLQVTQTIEDDINPNTWPEKSLVFERAVSLYLQLLEQFEIPTDVVYATGVSKSRRTLQRALISAKKLGRKQLQRKQENLDAQNLQTLVIQLAKLYFPRVEHPLLELTVGQWLDLGYMVSLLGLTKAIQIPGGRRLLDSLSLNLTLQLKSLHQAGNLRRISRTIRSATRTVLFFRKASRALKAASLAGTRAFPTTFALSIAGDVAIQQVLDHYREFAYHRIGRLSIFALEQSRTQRAPFRPVLL